MSASANYAETSRGTLYQRYTPYPLVFEQMDVYHVCR
jgi:hypothetical protein